MPRRGRALPSGSTVEEVPERRPLGPLGRPTLEVRESLLHRSDAPACVGAELLDRRSVLVERADVAQLYGGAIPLFDPAERQTLRAADVGAIGVDAARAELVEEGARPLGVWHTRGQELRVPGANALRLHVEDGQIIDAARLAALLALQARGVEHVQTASLAGDVGVQQLDRVGRCHLRKIRGAARACRYLCA